jgi:hypothetical protein
LDDWKPLASLVLNAAYEATAFAAFLNAQRHQFEGSSAKVIKSATFKLWDTCKLYWCFS